MTRPSSATLIVIAAALPACSHYTLAGRDADAVPESLAVQTVVVDASDGADTGDLTRWLVESLRREGLVGARWATDSPAAGALRCDVVTIDESFGQSVRVSASARCLLSGVVVSERYGDAQLVSQPQARIETYRRAVELASREALAAASIDVARAVRETVATRSGAR